MKMRFFLRGLGAGIVLTALILCVGYRINAPEQNIVEEAQKLGMIFPEGTVAPVNTVAPHATGEQSQQQKAQQQTQQQSSANKATASMATASMATASMAVATPSKNAGVTNSAGEKKGQPGKIQGTRFTVRGGLLSSSVAREMMEAGIIKSDKVLDDLLEKSGYAREIQAGTYFIPAGSTYEEIAKIITGRQ